MSAIDAQLHLAKYDVLGVGDDDETLWTGPVDSKQCLLTNRRKKGFVKMLR